MIAKPYSPSVQGGPRMFNPAKTNHKDNCPARIVIGKQDRIKIDLRRFRRFVFPK